MPDTLLSIPSSGVAGSTSGQSYTDYTYSYTATLAQTYITFEFRQDPAYWGLDDISVKNSGGTNLVGNGGFETGDLTDWTLIGTQGLDAAGEVSSGSPGTSTENSHSGSYFFSDGAVGGVDGIYQSFNTVVGQTYTANFWLANDGGGPALALVEVGAKDAAYSNDASAPGNLALAAGGTVTSPDSETTANTTPTIIGTADAGASVTVTIDDVTIGTATANETGVWSVTDTAPLTAGTHVVGATAQIGSGTPSAETDLTLTVTAPAVTSALTLAVATDSGVIGDGTTNIATPTLVGTATAGDTVTLADDTGGTPITIGTAVADQTGNWSYTPTLPVADGTYKLVATETLAGGTVLPSSTPFALTIDTTAPAAPLLALAATSDSGTRGDDITNVTTPTISGPGEVGDAVTLFDGTTQVGSGIVGQDGTWAITSGVLAPGTHSDGCGAAEGLRLIRS